MSPDQFRVFGLNSSCNEFLRFCDCCTLEMELFVILKSQ